MGPRSYVEPGDGTLVDQMTGLTWQLVASPNSFQHQPAADYCAALLPEGHWRLPSFLEMISLVDYGRESLLPAAMAIDWSGATFLLGGPGLWVRDDSSLPQDALWHYYFMFGLHGDAGASFQGGEATWGGSGIERFALCVSGDSLSAAPILESCCDPPVARDSLTGLVWQAVPSSTEFDWYGAQNHCRDIPENGAGWRLPSVKELATIFKPDSLRNVVPPIPPVDPNVGAVFWSSTPAYVRPATPNRAFVVNFVPESAYTFPIRPELPTSPFRAWCVRSYDPDAP